MQMSSNESPPVRPRSLGELFTVFTRLALQGFGGVLPVAQRVLCEETRWLSRAEFTETLALAQVLPGPNLCNLALMIGDRYFGLRGAFMALAGMIAVPLIVVLVLAALLAHGADAPWVVDTLRGMGAVSAGLMMGTALKLASGLKHSPLRRIGAALVALAAFLAVVALRLPLWAVIAALGPLSIGLSALLARRP